MSARADMTDRILWVTDPWHTLDHAKDTTLRLIEESARLGIESLWCDVRSVRWEDGKILVDACRVRFDGAGPDAEVSGNPIDRLPAQPVDVRAFSRIVYRTDPPVDLNYLHPLQLLVLGVEGSRAEIVNPPAVLFSASEKLEGAQLGDLLAPSRAATRWSDLQRFGCDEKKTVLKPLYQAQSKGVELLDWSTAEGRDHARRALHAATDAFRRPALLQRYFDGIREGEQRLWFVNGELLGAVRKKPKSGEFRVNMDQGGSVVATTLNAAEQEAAARIGKHLESRKIRMAAVDLIEGRITDFNFTSPGLLRQMEAVLGENLAGRVLRGLIASWP